MSNDPEDYEVGQTVVFVQKDGDDWQMNEGEVKDVRENDRGEMCVQVAWDDGANTLTQIRKEGLSIKDD